jgi:hypothetical protein
MSLVIVLQNRELWLRVTGYFCYGFVSDDELVLPWCTFHRFNWLRVCFVTAYGFF